MHTYQEYKDFILGGRNKKDRPLANNTRVILRGEDIAIRFHSTDVVTYYPNGTVELNSGGWHSVTTKERIGSFSPARVETDDGVWYVKTQPNPNDPRPMFDGEQWPRRQVAKPFTVANPGAEPIWNGDHPDCIVGTVSESKHNWNHSQVKFVRTRYESYTHGNEQCSHCAEFDRIHEYWNERMNGTYRQGGYKQMVDAIELYGTREAWQEAYITDFRKHRANRKLHREWIERNRARFTDGMLVDAEGFASPAPHTNDVKKLNQMKAKIAKFVKYCISELEAGNVPMPSAGDCWYCSMVTADEKSLGDASANHEHLLAHIEEKYVVPSMLINAMRERGYVDAGIGIMLGMDIENNVMGLRYMNADAVSRALRAYLQCRLVPEASNSTPAGAGLQTAWS